MSSVADGVKPTFGQLREIVKKNRDYKESVRKFNDLSFKEQKLLLKVEEKNQTRTELENTTADQ